MSKVDSTKERERVKKDREQYMLAAKEFAGLLVTASKMDSRVLSISRDIAKVGDSISVIDSRAVTDFYNQLLAHSKIDSRYHSIVRNLREAKSKTDNLAHRLFNSQVIYALKKAGLPSIKHNLETREIAEYINDRKLPLLSKVAYGTDYIKEEILEIEAMIDRGDVTIAEANIVGQTRAAKTYLRALEKTLIRRVNDDYFGPKTLDIKRVYISAKNDKTNLLGLLTSLGDDEHLREFERRIAAGDITLVKGAMLPQTEKGQRYMRLLSEELNSLLETRMNQQILAANSQSLAGDILLNNVFEIINSFENKLTKHKEITGKLGFDSTYLDVVEHYGGDILALVQSKNEILESVDKLSAAALDIRKKLILLANHNEIKVEDSLPVLTALKLLANHEQALDQKIAALAAKTKYRMPVVENKIPTIQDIRERDGGGDADYELSAKNEISRILEGQESDEADLAETVRYVVGRSEYTEAYVEICSELAALRSYLVEYLDKEDRLYRGNELVQTILTEIVEKEIERRELLSEIAHAVHLAHKKLWLSKIRSGNNGYLSENIGNDLPSLTYAKRLNAKILDDIEKQITETINNYRNNHESHARKFLQVLGRLSEEVNNGGDISQIAQDLREEYRALEAGHRAELATLEKEMRKLDSQLTKLPEKSRKVIEKSLISDIKERVNL